MLKDILKSIKETKIIQIEIEFPVGVEFKDVEDCIHDFLWDLENSYSTSVVGDIDDYDTSVLVDVYVDTDKNKFKKVLDKLQKKYSDCVYQIIVKG